MEGKQAVEPRNFSFVGIDELLQGLDPQSVDGEAQVSSQFEDFVDLHIVDIITIFVRQVETCAVKNKLGESSWRAEQICKIFIVNQF